MPTQLAPLINWFETSIVGSPLWSGLGLVAAALFGLFVLWTAFKLLARGIRSVSETLSSRKRRSTQGFGIAVAPIVGPGGGKQTKAVIAALQEHLGLFTFGSPFEIVKAPRIRTRGAKGLRASAVRYLERSSTDLVLWGARTSGKQTPSEVEILSCAGSLAPADAMHFEGFFPLLTPQNQDITFRVAAYLVARALQPGLSDGSAFKAEKLEPVADILVTCLENPDAIQERTRRTLEHDYSSMALNIGGETHLTRVAKLRRQSLSSEEKLPPSFEVHARIDLGRALLGLAAISFDPVRVREAMDHLKIAVDMLKSDEVLQLAQITNQAVQQGQAMLANRKRFSVTGGSTI
ncbi:MAG: hypothetical protein JJ931_16575 [Henriciella sp.]|nr:hypothetical protein [Henriciella sp.]MBO6697016.1 hypothetical protein [Henriciella sp.]